MTKNFIKYLLLICFFCQGITVLAQVKVDTTQKGLIKIPNADRYIKNVVNGEEVDSLLGEVVIYHDSTFMYSDLAIIRNQNKLIATGNVSIVQHDTIQIFCDSLVYDAENKKADFYSDVVMVKNEQRLRTQHLSYDLENQIGTYTTEAILKDEQTLLRSKSGIYNAKEDIMYFREKVEVIDSSLVLRTDTLDYFIREDKAYFRGPTRIDQDSSIIYCEKGSYTLKDRIAYLEGNPQYKKGDTEASSDVMVFDGISGEMVLEGNARYESPNEKASAVKIVYYESTGNSTMTGDVIFEDSTRKITGDFLDYHKDEGKVLTQGRTLITDAPTFLIADQIDYSSKTGIGYAEGDVVWRDTSRQIKIFCDQLDYNDSLSTVKAFGIETRPLIEQIIDQDTIYLSADTLYSESVVLEKSIKPVAKDTLESKPVVFKGRRASVDSIPSTKLDSIPSSPRDSIPSTKLDSLPSVPIDSLNSPVIVANIEYDTVNIFHAYPAVQIFSTQFQSVSDSLTYHSRDSIFTLYDQPILWSDSTQFSGDTIYIYLRNQTVDRLFMTPNGFVISHDTLDYYNQIKGRSVEAFFLSGEVDRLIASGNAESIYCLKDDSDEYIGINKASCSRILGLFKEGELDILKFLSEPDSKVIPMKDASPGSSVTLSGWRWAMDRMPVSKEEIRKR